MVGKGLQRKGLMGIGPTRDRIDRMIGSAPRDRLRTSVRYRILTVNDRLFIVILPKTTVLVPYSIVIQAHGL